MSFGIPVRNGLGVGLLASTTLSTRRGGTPFSPASLFAAGEQGYWLDPSDFTTMFQDAAGVTPVTATGQSVRRILDKSGRGNHFTQANAANAPILGVEPFGGRRNLLTFTEQFDNAAWVLQGAGTGVAPTRTLGAGTSPAGVTACRLQFSLGGGTTTSDQSIFRQSATVPSGAGVFSVWLRSTDGTSSYVMQLTDPSGNGQNITVTGTWQRFQVTGTSPGTAINYQLRLRGGQTPANSNTADVLFSEPQVETGSTATAYQRVTDQWNVTQAGVADCYYLAFDGTDDWLQSVATINPGAVDKAQVFAGVRKLSDAARGMVLETGLGLQSGSIALQAPSSNGAANYGPLAGGTTLVGVNPTTFTAPITNVISFTADIPADSLVARINGSQVAQSANDQGTGNFLTYTHFIGRRGGTGLPYNGRIYQMVMRFGPNLTAGQITQTETFVNSKTGAY